MTKKASNDILRKFPISRGADQTEKCTLCHHELGAHNGTVCPPIPPSQKDVKVDEATAPKSLKQELDDAMGVTAAKKLEAEAAKHFNAETPEAMNEVVYISFDELKPSPFQPREGLGDLTELIASIKKHSRVLQPILVRQVGDAGVDGAYETISGHRRAAAAKKAGLESVPALVLENVSDVQVLELNLTEQINRKDLTPLEEADACRKLQELAGYTVDQVAAKLGQSPTWVRRRLQLTKLAPEARKALAAGKIPYAAAVELALLPAHKMQAELLADLLRFEDHRVSADSLIRAVERRFRPLKSAPWNLTDAELLPEAGACSACPKNSACGPKGLFDNLDAKQATCTDVKCFEEKTALDWEKKTEKARAEGAEILEDVHYFNPGGDLTYSAEQAGIVKAKELAPRDRQKRTWAQLREELPEKHRPRLKVAKTAEGAAGLVFDGNALRKALVKHLDMKWAKPKPKADPHSGLSPAMQEKRRKEKAESKVRDAVVDEVLEHITRRIANAGLELAELRAIARAAFDAVDELGDGPLRALGLFDKKPDDIEKWIEKKATANELQALLFASVAKQSSLAVTFSGIDSELVELAKRYRLDPAAMIKARVADEKKGKAAA